MGYLEVNQLAECLWIYRHSMADMYAWQQANGIDPDKYLIASGSITVEQTKQGLLLYCEVYPRGEDGCGLWDAENGHRVSHAVVLPYIEPIPEGIGTLIDWDFKLPNKPRPVTEDDL